MLSLPVRSGRSSSQCAPVGPSSAWWNDKQNDIAELASAPQPSEAGWLMAGEGDADLGFAADDGDAFYRTCLAVIRLAAIPAP